MMIPEVKSLLQMHMLVVHIVRDLLKSTQREIFRWLVSLFKEIPKLPMMNK